MHTTRDLASAEEIRNGFVRLSFQHLGKTTSGEDRGEKLTKIKAGLVGWLVGWLGEHRVV